MAIIMSESDKDIILKKITEDSSNKNPFIQELDVMYLRYDSIEISIEGIILTIIYKWRGTEMYRMHENFIAGHGNTCMLTGVDGRIKMSLLPT